jgi:hypothetical protein
MAINTSAGSKLFVTASAPATYTQAGFTALTFTEVGELTNLGEFGREYALVTHNPVGDRRTIKRKGSFNEGSISLEMALDNDDAGQVLLKAAADSDLSYSFKLQTQNGDIYYFSAQTMSFRVSVGTVDQITSATAMLEIDGDIIEVPAM